MSERGLVERVAQIRAETLLIDHEGRETVMKLGIGKNLARAIIEKVADAVERYAYDEKWLPKVQSGILVSADHLRSQARDDSDE